MGDMPHSAASRDCLRLDGGARIVYVQHYEVVPVAGLEAARCEMAECAHPTYSRCTKCNRKVCSSHAENCECCDKTFCQACYREHSREQESY
jgi:hypothetical protein